LALIELIASGGLSPSSTPSSRSTSFGRSIGIARSEATPPKRSARFKIALPTSCGTILAPNSCCSKTSAARHTSAFVTATSMAWIGMCRPGNVMR
jgi:hypothetical protein